MKIENCRQLVYTLSNVEEGNPGEYGLICVYDETNYGICIGIFNSAKTCAVFLHTTPNSVGSMISRNLLYSKRFRIERVKI